MVARETRGRVYSYVNPRVENYARKIFFASEVREYNFIKRIYFCGVENRRGEGVVRLERIDNADEL